MWMWALSASVLTGLPDLCALRTEQEVGTVSGPEDHILTLVYISSTCQKVWPQS